MKSQLALASLCLVLTLPARAAAPASPSSNPDDETAVKDSGPYAMIVARNVFRLNPIPPPVQVTNEPPAPPPSPLQLTGLSRFGRTPIRALLANKPANPTNVLFFNLAEGERKDNLEILKINEAEESVEIMYAGVRSTVLLKDSKHEPSAAPAAGVLGAQPGQAGFVPGVPMRTAVPGAVVTPGIPNPAAPNRSAASVSGGVSPSAPIQGGGGSGVIISGAMDPTMPTRNMRAGTDLPTAGYQTTKEESAALLLLQSQPVPGQKKPIPPMPPMPGM